MIYLDNGATSFPKPKGVLEEMENCMRHYCGNPGRSGHKMSMVMGEKIYETRKSVANLLGIKNPSQIIFTKNTTESLNLALWGVLQEGDHVITTAMEHNSVLRPLHAMKPIGISHTIVPANCYGEVSTKDIIAAVKPETRMIVMTGASNVTGTLMPVKEVCHWANAKGILTLIDGAQWVGSIPLNVEDMAMTMLAFPGHKGLLGPQGTGALYVSPSRYNAFESCDLNHCAGELLQPLIFGGTGTASKSVDQPRDLPEDYEAGTVNGPGLVGLGRSVRIVERIGAETIAYYEKELCRELETHLRNMDFVTIYGPSPEKKVGITLFTIQGISSEEVTERLSREYGIAVRGGYHCAPLAHQAIGTFDGGAVRLSIGPFNTRKEIRKAAEAVYRIGKTCK